MWPSKSITVDQSTHLHPEGAALQVGQLGACCVCGQQVLYVQAGRFGAQEHGLLVVEAFVGMVQLIQDLHGGTQRCIHDENEKNERLLLFAYY
jgi:hypothetical protein